MKTTKSNGFVRITAAKGKVIVDIRNMSEYSEIIVRENKVSFFIEK